MELIQDNIKVEWQDIGEGLCGDYNENDSEDAPLLRFYFSQLVDSEWQDLDDGSYCTLVKTTANEENQKKLLQILMNAAFDDIKAGSYKKRLEELSYISEAMLGQKILEPISRTTGDKWKTALLNVPQEKRRYVKFAMSQETVNAYSLGMRKAELQEKMNRTLILRAMDLGHIMTLEEEKTLPKFDFLIEMSEPLKPEEMISSILSKPIQIDDKIPFGEFEMHYGEPFKG